MGVVCKRGITVLALILLPVWCFAANHYIREGATGLADGSDWTNAWADLPATFTRGDTYYVADGSYGSHTFNTEESTSPSGLYIYIKKATASDHGTDTGWNASYGDGQALFEAGWTFSTSYWDVNGLSGTLDGTFGIKVKRTNSDGKVVQINQGVSNINLTYLDLENAGYSSASWANADVLYVGVSGGANDINVTSCWLHNSNRTLVFLYNTYNTVFDGCWFTENINMDSYGVHGEAFSINITQNLGTSFIKNSVFRNIEGSAWIGFMNSFGDRTNYNWNIYNNVFYVDSDHVLDGYIGDGLPPSESDFTGSNSIIDVLSSATAYNINIIGNTFANMQQNTIVTLSTDCTNCIVRNNLFIHEIITGTFAGTTTSNNTSTTDTTYVANYTNHNYTLAKATTAGYTLSSPYNTDMLGNTRGADGTWDRGAYEYGVSLPSISGCTIVGGSIQ